MVSAKAKTLNPKSRVDLNQAWAEPCKVRACQELSWAEGGVKVRSSCLTNLL